MSINLIICKLFFVGTLLFSLFSITTSSQVVSVILLIGSFVCAALLLVNLGLLFVGLSYIIIYVGAIAVLFLFVIMMIDINTPKISTSDKEYTQNLPLAISLGSIFTVFYNSLIHISPTGFYVPSISVSNIIGWVSNSIIKIFNKILILLYSPSSAFNSNFYNLSQEGESFITSPDILHYTSNPNGDFFSLYQVSHADTQLKTFEQISSLGFGLYNYYPLVYLLTGFILLFSMYSAVILTKRKEEE